MTLDLSIVIPFLSAIFGGYISFYFASKSKKDEAIVRFREEKYANMLILLQGFVGETVSYETKRNFFDEQYKSWIYSSDEVVIAINALVELLIDNDGKDTIPEEGKKVVGNIVLAMRKDLLKKTSLSYKDFRYTTVRKNG
jgi:hypothetical protein